MLRATFCCFRVWFWACRRLWGIICCKYIFLRYISTHKFDVICISETYLDSDTSDDDDNLKTAGCNFIRADHPSNTKRSGVCIYYKHSLAFRLLNIHYFKECMNFEISFGGKICNFISLYR